MSVIAELSIFPLDKGESVSPYVARALGVIRDSGLPHALGPMGTCIEGDYDPVMAVVRGCVEALRPDCRRIIVNLKLDIRQGRAGGLAAKPASVLEKLG
ncbi:MAG: MTH1187 family thiamine-binding protein [Thermodesulfobacteriota bacterium]